MGICAACLLLAGAAARPSDALQIPLLPGILLPFLIWHFPCCSWDQSKHILNVHLLHPSSCSASSAFWLMAPILKVFCSSAKLVPNSWGHLKAPMDAYLHAKAPKILSQSGPCLGQWLLYSSSWLMTKQKQDSNQVLHLQTAWWQSFSTGPTLFFFAFEIFLTIIYWLFLFCLQRNLLFLPGNK